MLNSDNRSLLSRNQPKAKAERPKSGKIEIIEEAPPQRRKKKKTPPPPPKPERAGNDSEAEVEAALDEFDAFLDSATGWGKGGNRSGIPGWEEGERNDDNPFAREDSGWHDPPSGGGFSLFDERSEGDSLGLRDLVQSHEESLDRLRREVQQQREIISALVDALVEANVVSKRDIKDRAKRNK